MISTLTVSGIIPAITHGCFPIAPGLLSPSKCSRRLFIFPSVLSLGLASARNTLRGPAGFLFNQMIFRIQRREKGFVQIDNALLENEVLSWKAKGLLCYLLSKPADWRVILGDLVARGTDGPTAIRSALVELRGAGYARLETSRTSAGTLDGTTWSIFEERQSTEMQETLISDTDMQVSRVSGNPSLGKSHPTNTDRKKDEGDKDGTAVRPRNPLFDALAEVEGSDADEAAKLKGGKIAKALSQIKRMSPDVTPEEIKRRAGLYRETWPNVTLSATALAQNWAKFKTKPNAHAPHQKPNGRAFAQSGNYAGITDK